MTVWIYVDASEKVGDKDHLKVFANEDAAEIWFKENDPEGVAFEHRRRGPSLLAGGILGNHRSERRGEGCQAVGGTRVGLRPIGIAAAQRGSLRVFAEERDYRWRIDLRHPFLPATVSIRSYRDSRLIVFAARVGPRQPRNSSFLSSSAFVARKNCSSSSRARAGR